MAEEMTFLPGPVADPRGIGRCAAGSCAGVRKTASMGSRFRRNIMQLIKSLGNEVKAGTSDITLKR